MPRGTFTDDFKTGTQVNQFDYLKFEYTDELARLLVVGDALWWEWVHSMRAPVIADGRPVIVDKTRRDGTTYPDYNMGFVGQRICFGDPDVLADKRLDPDRCRGCLSAKNGVAGMAPERRFAFPVIRYKTKRGTVDLQSPVGGDLLVWKLSQKMYNQLKAQEAEIRELLQAPEGQRVTLSSADIVLQCRSKEFQGVDFKAPRRPAHAHPEVAAFVKALWGDVANRPTDAQMQAACGRANDEDSRIWMERDVEDVENRWRTAERFGKNGVLLPDPTGDGVVSGGQQQSVDASLNDLLVDHPAAPAAQPAAPAVAVDPFAGDSAPAAQFAAPAVADDPFSSAPAAQPAAPVAAVDPFAGDSAPAAPPQPVPAAAPAAGNSFDDILAGLDSVA